MKLLKNDFWAEGFSLCMCEPEDAEEVKRAEDICFPGDPWSLSVIKETLEKETGTVLAVTDRQTTNIISYGIIISCLDEADLANIATLPEYRGQGIGGALLDEMIEKSGASGVLRIFLEVRASNAAALGLYGSRGFSKIGIRRNYYRKPLEDAIVMVREEK